MTLDLLRDRFLIEFGKSPELFVRAPGRVNLIGEHTDYNDGLVFPAAIDRYVYAAASRVDGPTEVVSTEFGRSGAFAAATVVPGEVCGWIRYVAGMCWALAGKGIRLNGSQMLIDSDLPVGSGLSSSAAVEMAVGRALLTLAGAAISPIELAVAGQDCENRFVGVQCGLMDQAASALGRQGSALFFDTRSHEVEYVTFPAGIEIAICNTNQKRSLDSSEYNLRRKQCEEASRICGVKSLRDAGLSTISAHEGQLGKVRFCRAKHVITENERCVQFKVALQANDLDLAGRLMRDSHMSLKLDYEVSSDALDAMAESAWLAPGCVGARMTGAGFGGACVALVRSHERKEFREATLSSFFDSTGRTGDVLFCTAADGAMCLA